MSKTDELLETIEDIKIGIAFQRIPCSKKASIGKNIAALNEIAEIVKAHGEIVHCRECKWWGRHTDVNTSRGQCWRFMSTTGENSFCSAGRKEATDATD